jgi:pimeloyl-ACP methyl ester carboxylesterase
MFKDLRILWAFAFCFLILVLVLSVRFDIPVEELRLKYSGKSSQFISLMGMQVHYRDEGPASDTIPLVLIHGTSSSLHTWDKLVSVIANRKRVIRLDLPAFGLTGPSPDNIYDFEFYNTFLESLFIKMNIRHCVLAGNSLGGSIAWNYAVRFPARLNGLVLIDAGGYPKKNERGSLGFKLAAMPGINNLLLFITPRALVRKSLEDAYFNKSLVSDSLVQRYHDLILRSGNRGAALSLFKNPMRSDTAQITGIKIPTLIIWGKEDQLISYEHAYQFQRDITGSKLIMLEHIGHVPMEEAPDRVAEAILKFNYE